MRAHRDRGEGGGGGAPIDRAGTPGKQTLVEVIQRQAAASPASPTAAASGTGGALAPALQAKMERAFSFDFARVRVHEGSEAQALGAAAFTRGSDLHFAPGQYQPESPRGQELIGHELAHVVQQQEGRVPATTQFKGVEGNDDAGLEREADDWGTRAARGEAVQRGGGGGGDGGDAVQRKVVQCNRNITETTDTGNQYTQQLALDKTRNHVQIQLGVKWVKQGTWATDQAYDTWREWVKTSVYGYMDNKFKVELTPPSGPKFYVTIDFLLRDDDAGYQIQCWGNTHGRGAMSSGGGNLYELGQAGETAMPAVYAAHEFGHALLGVSDEYVNPAVPGRAISNDHSIMGDFYSQGTAKAEYKVRHFQNIAREVGTDYPGHTAKLVPA